MRLCIWRLDLVFFQISLTLPRRYDRDELRHHRDGSINEWRPVEPLSEK